MTSVLYLSVYVYVFRYSTTSRYCCEGLAGVRSVGKLFFSPLAAISPSTEMIVVASRVAPTAKNWPHYCLMCGVFGASVGEFGRPSASWENSSRENNPRKLLGISVFCLSVLIGWARPSFMGCDRTSFFTFFHEFFWAILTEG
ncbi:unnamed protein product [Scytosiphon promiscuus]